MLEIICCICLFPHLLPSFFLVFYFFFIVLLYHFKSFCQYFFINFLEIIFCIYFIYQPSFFSLIYVLFYFLRCNYTFVQMYCQ